VEARTSLYNAYADLIYASVLALFFLFQLLFFSGYETKEVAYSQFRSWIAEGRIEDVVISGDQIVGELKAPESKGTPDSGEVSPPSKKTPWHLGSMWSWVTRQRAEFEAARARSKENRERHFTVTRLEDPELIADLQTAGVEYRGKIESEWFKNFLQNWIIPFGLLFLLWGFVMRRMQHGPSALNLGRSKAKVFEADPDNPVGFSDVAGVDEAIEEVQEVVSLLKHPEK